MPMPLAARPCCSLKTIETVLSLCSVILWMSIAWGAEPTPDGRGALQAGAYAQNINPQRLPVWVNGGISGRQIDRITDPLHARSLVLGDGTTQVAICVVDNCILPLELIDRAKELAHAKTGIDASHIMISATHTHSAVSVAGTHGTPVQEDYAAELPGWIANSIAKAQERMVPAQWGTTTVVCDKYIYCRDWMMKPGTASSTPFSGRASDSVAMNPGHDNPNKLAPIGPVDTLIPILSIQDLQGKPISLLATFCTHYAGAPNISADYFAVVCNRLAKALRPDDPAAFVGLMSNSTSGNANCIDFSKPSEPFTHFDVGNFVSDKILSVVPSIEYSRTITLDAELRSIDLAVRMPTATEVATAKRYIETHFPDRLPVSLDENYARETVLLSEMPPTRKLNLQAFRLNDFIITANPCESYNETGLKLRQASPFRLTMNVGLANGHAGYIPPPELFQLGGYTTWRCRSSCLEEQAESKMVAGLTQVMQALYGRRQVNKNTVTQSPPSPPLSPSESLEWMVLEPGYKIELAASEPQIVDPISMQIDERGRMWIVEMRDYPTADDKPKSRVVVLEDKDKDGFFESSYVFADRLQFATGVQPWQDGALVTVQGKLIMLRDTDGDLQADKTEVWLEGFAAENPQLRANHPTIAMDGWLYIASGLRGGKIKSSVPFAKEPGQEVDIMGSDLRLHMVTGEIEAISGPSQFGLSFDMFGHRYGCSNRQPCFEIVAERNELSLSPLAGLASPLHEVSKGETASRVHPLVNAWTTSNLHAGQFTAACGLLVTHSPHFLNASSSSASKNFFATALTCEPTGGLVQRRSLEQVRGRSVAIDESTEQEWLASYDPWFRPVDLYEGPDGDIYIVDMYRAVIEHPDWVPAELKNRPDQRLGDSKGRIYRVTRGEARQRKEDSAILAKDSDFASWMKHPHTWNRNIATRRALEKMHEGQDSRAEVAAQLQRLLESDASTISVGSLVQAYLLGTSCRLLDTPKFELPSAFRNKQSGVRAIDRESLVKKRDRTNEVPFNEKAATLIESNQSSDALLSLAWFLAINPTQTSSGRNSQSSEDSVYAKVLVENMNDPHIWMAITAARRESLPSLVSAYWKAGLASEIVAPESMAREATRRLAFKAAQPLTKQQTTENAETMVSAMTSAKPNSPGCQMVFAILEGYANADRLQVAPKSLLERTILTNAASNDDLHIRRIAIALLAACPSESASKLAFQTLESEEPKFVKQAIETCSARDTPEFTHWLLEHFGSALPEIRQSIFTAIRSHPGRLLAMVERLESGALTLKQFDAAQIQNLKAIQNADVAPKLTKILAASINGNRQKVIDDYSAQLSTIQVSERNNQGRSVFEKNCAVCHRLDGVGTAIGPDISDSREQSFEKLLISVLDPNRAIDANYFRYLARTHDGSVFEGLLKDANAQTITLQNQNGSKTLERADIEELKSSGTSLMPEGIEAQISVREMADLLWYIKNWRYATNGVPANASLSN